MHDFVNTYRLQAATTEDFKAMVEKHMSRGMDLEGNHRMDWFFSEYVYGTDLPAYHFEGDATPNGEGWNVHFKLTQSGVGANFGNAVPIYLELADGKVVTPGFGDHPWFENHRTDCAVAQVVCSDQKGVDQLLLRRAVHG